ncbi:MAG: TonB-dependent receptor, partial [Porphyromonas sp.]|nr:TonB-dependent receptor [Porphyromonas sp.]
GALSDLDGHFSITGIPANSTLRISYVGYKTQEIALAGQTSLNIKLIPDSEILDEVVVVGYGTQKKVNVTGAVSAVSSKDIEGVPVANTTTLLQGRITGLNITNNGAQAGADTPEIRIRGIGTFGNSNPMVLIDGVEGSLGQISDIPASDIESISVLKDAASAAIYGVRAANGVILITTKRGMEGSMQVTYNGNFTLQTPGILPDFVNSYEWAQMKNEVSPDTYSPEALQKLKDGSDPDHYADTDWLGAVLRNAPMHQHNLSVSGGSKNIRFMTSISFVDQKGIMIETGVKRFAFRSNLDANYKRFIFGLNVSGNKNRLTNPGMAVSGDGGVLRRVAWFTRPTVPLMYSNGHYGYIDGSITDAELVKNPLESMRSGYRLNDAWRFNGKVFAGFNIIDGLQFKTSLAYAFYLNATKSYSPGNMHKYTPEGQIAKAGTPTNSLTDYYWRDYTWTNENLLTYDKRFGSHKISALLGHSLIGYNNYITSASKQGFPTDLIYELSGGTSVPGSSGSSQAYRLQSFFGRVQYSYDDRYMAEFNIRRDGSSRMPSSNRYATFPSISVGWVFSGEEFLSQYTWLFGKLRASWGNLGNQEIGNYAYLATLGASGNYYFDENGSPQAGMRQTSIPNEDIRWETTRNINVGVDLGFFQNKITTSFDWFDKKTSDILMQLAMPGIFLGSLPAPYQNVGEVRNRGWEWSANYQDSKGDWNWYAGFNVSHVKNEILYMGGLEERISGSTINRVGEPIGAYYAWKAIGLYRTEKDLKRTNSKGEIIKQNGAAPKLGDIMYADIDDDGNINDKDRVIIGNPFPSFTYGFNFGFGWKGLDFSTLWQGVAGIYRYSWETTTDIRGNLTTRFLDRYSSDNINGSMPALGNAINDTMSSFWLEKSDYLRLKNLELGYTFDRGLSALGIAKMRVYFAATNLLTFTPLKNWDPEKTSGDTSNQIHPNSQTYSFGVNVTF